MASRSKDYNSAASYFQQLSTFYHNNDWARLEIPMLDMYAQCLKQLDRRLDFCRIGLQILAQTARRPGSLQHVSGVSRHEDSEELGHYLDDVLEASNALQRSISAPLQKQFGRILLHPYIRHFDDRDGFQMTLSLQNLMPVAFTAEEVRVKLVNVDNDQRSDIWLKTGDPDHLGPGTTDVDVQTTAMCSGWFELERIDVKSANVVFTFDTASPSSNALVATSNNDADFNHVQEANAFRVLVWPGESSLDVQLSLCPNIHLGKPRSLEMVIVSRRNEIDRATVALKSCTAGLRIHTADAELNEDNGTFRDKSQPGVLELGSMASDSDVRIRIPYGLESDLNDIKVRAEVRYSVGGREYTYTRNGEMRIQLPLNVNVQDCYQEDALVSHFQIGTASSIPARISYYRLPSTKSFHVAMSELEGDPVDVFARQPLSLLANIRRKMYGARSSQSPKTTDRTLMLQIRYACLDQEVMVAVEDVLSKALHASIFGTYRRLLLAAFARSLRSKLSMQDFETIALLREVQIEPYEYYDWDSILDGLDSESKAELTSWLQTWHKEHSSISLPEDINPRTTLELTVPVEIPTVPAVFTAWLDIQGYSTGDGEYRSAPADQPLLANLSILWSRYWDIDARHPDDEPLHITCEIDANPDVWLIGGQRKIHFSAKPAEETKIPIILLPQKSGHLFYPSVDIRAARSGKSEGDGKAVDEEVQCEVDYLSQSESILVVPNLSSVTVSLDGGAEVGVVDMRSRDGG
ncbi:MAG: hypothetical protein Q9174_005712 [Haloplaca sp. 1 TL-2023]